MFTPMHVSECCFYEAFFRQPALHSIPRRRRAAPLQQMSGKRRCFALVTGASRGFGKGVAEELVRKIAPVYPLDVVLVARNESRLQSAAEDLEGIVRELSGAKKVVIRQKCVDLADLKNLEDRLGELFAAIDPGIYSQAVLVNNAGKFGHIGLANEVPSLSILKEDIDFNVTSCLWLTSLFAKLFGAHRPIKGPIDATNTGEQQEPVVSADMVASADERTFSDNVIIHVSSLAAVQPFRLWCGYATGKAARDMFHRVLAEEQKELGGLRVLNYAPGSMHTDMSADVRERGGGNTFDHVDVEVSAAKCVRLALGERSFDSGAHIDFFDKEYD